ncbi:membrane protein insertion efficiency factor YidD [Ampullimonas aquatilis]|uniref:membrane protein insertion efficiency factor YidD n=1 Tax=Ampullimonas aquatilis TaxID=1341549 RepID=UPI003C73D4E0
MMKKFIQSLIRLYQLFLSPLLGSRCRFEPSCSQYMLVAIDRHGSSAGLTMGLRRLCRCHPFNPGGFDPVPENKGNDQTDVFST